MTRSCGETAGCETQTVTQSASGSFTLTPLPSMDVVLGDGLVDYAMRHGFEHNPPPPKPANYTDHQFKVTGPMKIQARGQTLTRGLRISGEAGGLPGEDASRTVGYVFVRTDPKTKEDIWERGEEARQRTVISGGSFTCSVKGVNLWYGGSYSTLNDQGRATCTVSLAPIR